MELTLTIDSRPLTLELDDVVAGLLAVRLNVPSDTDTRAALCRYLSDEAARGCSTRTICASASCGA